MRRPTHVVTKLKFPQILLKMPSADGDIRAVDAALQDVPERLNVVRVNVAARPFLL